ncbi:DUF4197 domain-containing protein [Denitrobaculum tricleocarpae]|uniref:DUF4197 domain-containing protein n=1 Tax=Denitrobaculum tricleocarpae TaxID=2591009 RepID=A0A545TXC4_9PROT|nr:DUF4197 domain-containing protein [Denitrobaculum tricleocarpae]TQV81878.1 DUF4197 domain-containing protein [Denitrobaculum tricleocarpae]
MRTAFIASVALLAALPLSQSMAQSDWLKKGTDLLNSSGASSGSGSTSGSAIGNLSAQELSDGLREALKVGSERVVDQVGQADGYNGDSNIRLPLPDSLKKVQSALELAGMSSMLDDLELRLNRAAEAAAPKAKALFLDAISEMSLEDAEKIYSGPDDAATRYFQGKMTGPLAKEMEPVVNQSLSDVGAIQSYDQVMGEYRSIPFVPDAKADLTDYVVDKGMDGIFYYLAQEEAAIRKDPLKRSTALLQKVFGAQ